MHPYDDEKIISGQGTIVLEMLSSHPDLEMVVIPMGGGGLIAGNAIAAKGVNPAIQIVGVEAARFPSMSNTLQGPPHYLWKFNHCRRYRGEGNGPPHPPHLPGAC